MTDVHTEESKKTVVSFILGLVIGAILVWVFMSADKDKKPADVKVIKEDDVTIKVDDNTDKKIETESAVAVPTLTVGDGSVVVASKKAGNTVTLEKVVYPIEEGWIGVREYNDGQLGYINGVIRFSKAGNVVPESIPLVTPTVKGQEYAIMMYTSGGDKAFNSASDKQLDKVYATFVAE